MPGQLRQTRTPAPRRVFHLSITRLHGTCIEEKGLRISDGAGNINLLMWGVLDHGSCMKKEPYLICTSFGARS